MTNTELDTLEELHSKSTRVVAWYPHPGQVRGPFGRWFEITKGSNGMGDEIKYPTPVADTADDARYAAAAMNSVPKLIAEIRKLKGELNKLVEGK
jgi:hypothetical protein